MKIALTLSATLLAVASFGFAHDGQDHAQTEQQQTEAAMIAAQKICPVTGMDLDAMGGPYKAKSGERSIFLCYKSCLGKPMKPEAWAQIKQNLIAAQGLCPIMKNELPADAASTVIEGHTVFVCCKPCVKKAQADPKATVKFVEAQYREHAAEKKSATK